MPSSSGRSATKKVSCSLSSWMPQWVSSAKGTVSPAGVGVVGSLLRRSSGVAQTLDAAKRAATAATARRYRVAMGQASPARRAPSRDPHALPWSDLPTVENGSPRRGFPLVRAVPRGLASGGPDARTLQRDPQLVPVGSVVGHRIVHHGTGNEGVALDLEQRSAYVHIQ